MGKTILQSTEVNMLSATPKWLFDIGLPRVPHGTVDVVHAADLPRAPDRVALHEAIAMDRTLVTVDQEFLGSWSIALSHPGVVIFEDRSANWIEIIRGLLHLEFRVGQHGQDRSLMQCRYVLRSNNALFQVLANGSELDLESWRQVRVKEASLVATIPNRS